MKFDAAASSSLRVKERSKGENLFENGVISQRERRKFEFPRLESKASLKSGDGLPVPCSIYE